MRTVSKSDVDFGAVGPDGVGVLILREKKQFVVGEREFELSQLSPEQLDRLYGMAKAVLAIGFSNDAVRRDLTILIAELIRQHTN